MTYGQLGLISNDKMKKNNVYKPKFVKPKGKKKIKEKAQPLV
jgi:hypothetical protein